jgi:dUTP pyrophosphatase
MSITIKFKKIHPNAKLPTQANVGDAAFDLYCVEDFDLSATETLLVKTGLQLASVEDSHLQDIFLHIVGRSGLAKRGIFPVGGIVDSSYRGEIGVLLHNGNSPVLANEGNGNISLQHPGVSFKAGDRIAQVVIQVIATNSEINKVSFEQTNEISPTTRGVGGFGSTGN